VENRIATGRKGQVLRKPKVRRKLYKLTGDLRPNVDEIIADLAERYNRREITTTQVWSYLRREHLALFKAMKFIKKGVGLHHDPVMVVGGGTQISEMLKEIGAKYEWVSFGEFSVRRILSEEGRQEATRILRENEREMTLFLVALGMTFKTAQSPAIPFGGIDFHFNTDILAALAFTSFHEIDILTLSNRVSEKEAALIKTFEKGIKTSDGRIKKMQTAKDLWKKLGIKIVGFESK